MAKTDNLNDFLTDIANTIRTKKGTTDPINAQDFSSEIESIETGPKYSSELPSWEDLELDNYISELPIGCQFMIKKNNYDFYYNYKEHTIYIVNSLTGEISNFQIFFQLESIPFLFNDNYLYYCKNSYNNLYVYDFNTRTESILINGSINQFYPSLNEKYKLIDFYPKISNSTYLYVILNNSFYIINTINNEIKEISFTIFDVTPNSISYIQKYTDNIFLIGLYYSTYNDTNYICRPVLYNIVSDSIIYNGEYSSTSIKDSFIYNNNIVLYGNNKFIIVNTNTNTNTIFSYTTNTDTIFVSNYFTDKNNFYNNPKMFLFNKYLFYIDSSIVKYINLSSDNLLSITSDYKVPRYTYYSSSYYIYNNIIYFILQKTSDSKYYILSFNNDTFTELANINSSAYQIEIMNNIMYIVSSSYGYSYDITSNSLNSLNDISSSRLIKTNNFIYSIQQSRPNSNTTYFVAYNSSFNQQKLKVITSLTTTKDLITLPNSYNYSYTWDIININNKNYIVPAGNNITFDISIRDNISNKYESLNSSPSLNDIIYELDESEDIPTIKPIYLKYKKS